MAPPMGSSGLMIFHDQGFLSQSLVCASKSAALSPKGRDDRVLRFSSPPGPRDAEPWLHLHPLHPLTDRSQ